MFKQIHLIRVGIFSLLSLSLLAEESFIPDPPSLNATNYILMDSISGRVLAEKGADERIEPASITKIMTGYVVVDQAEKGFVSLSDEVLISENCWRKKIEETFSYKRFKCINSICTGWSWSGTMCCRNSTRIFGLWAINKAI